MTSSIRCIRTFIAALCALTMVAWLAVPAMADDHADDRGNRPDHASEPGERRDGGVQAQSASEGAPHGHAYGHEQAPPEHAGGEGEGRTGAAGQADNDNDNEGDPNRGTVKVRDGLVDYDGSPRHEPHVGCDFTIHFLGFDEDEGRDFWLYLHAPTGEPGETLVHSGRTELEQAQGNEHSASVQLTFDGLDGRDLFDEDNYHDQQGWKVKLTVDGTKHKVFWIDCPADDVDADAAVGVDAEIDEIAVAVPGIDEDAESVAAVAADEDVSVLAGAIEADDDEVVAAADELPVTGGDIALIALLGLLFAGLGTAALRLNRGGESVSG
jgi:hypothetical protein